MSKINSTSKTYKKCANPKCNVSIFVKIYNNPDHSAYGTPIKAHRTKITCCRVCHSEWQRSISWEERIGKEKANQIREDRRTQLLNNNPSSDPIVAEKIRNGMTSYLEKHPEVRQGVNNPFFGHSHSPEQILKWKNDKLGKWSYNTVQKEKQTRNTPKKENHPNWRGGISNGEYGMEFTKELKEHVKKQYNYICQVCLGTPIKLDVHHIDYDKKNNQEINLVPLCKSCHAKTNFNRGEWENTLANKNKE